MAELNHFHSNLFKEYTIYKFDNSATAIPEIAENVNTLIYIPSDCTPNDIEQINKILSACQLSNEQVIILNQLIPWHQLRENTQIRTLILFQISPNDIGVNIHLPLHYPLGFDEKVWISTIHPQQMQLQPEAKSALWKNALKPHFIG